MCEWRDTWRELRRLKWKLESRFPFWEDDVRTLQRAMDLIVDEWGEVELPPMPPPKPLPPGHKPLTTAKIKEVAIEAYAQGLGNLAVKELRDGGWARLFEEKK